MKKILLVLGIIAGVLLVAYAGRFAYMAMVQHSLNSSSRAYVDETVQAIAATWSKDELLKRAAPDLLAAIEAQPPDTLDLLMAKFSTLGALKAYKGSKGEAMTKYDAQQELMMAEYNADATFEKGDAVIFVRLVQVEGQWRLLTFNVNSNFFQ